MCMMRFLYTGTAAALNSRMHLEKLAEIIIDSGGLGGCAANILGINGLGIEAK